MYQPRPSDLEWTENFLKVTNDGASWVAPAMGFFVVDHTNKKIKMTMKMPTCDNELLEMTKANFKRCGYEVDTTAADALKYAD